MSINKELFAKVRDKILSTPESYDQTTFGKQDGRAPCGARACILGWADMLSTPENLKTLAVGGERLGSASDRGAKALGISFGEGLVVATSDGSTWPEPFNDRFLSAKTRRERAQVAAEYISWIIENDRVE
jgi:hypothetical protein